MLGVHFNRSFLASCLVYLNFIVTCGKKAIVLSALSFLFTTSTDNTQLTFHRSIFPTLFIFFGQNISICSAPFSCPRLHPNKRVYWVIKRKKIFDWPLWLSCGDSCGLRLPLIFNPVFLWALGDFSSLFRLILLKWAMPNQSFSRASGKWIAMITAGITAFSKPLNHFCNTGLQNG